MTSNLHSRLELLILALLPKDLSEQVIFVVSCRVAE